MRRLTSVYRYCAWCTVALILAGCSSKHRTPPPSGRLADPIVVVAQLNDQLRQWHGAPYRYGGMERSGVDCSGFVYRTFRDRFAIQLPRTTQEQTALGTRVSRDDLLPGDLVFFRTGRGDNGLHVGIYDTNDTFIHASTSQGVTRSSLGNVYWRNVYWQARRL
ncbi:MULTISPECIES: C40 family peptidase [Edwardsiella]|uniref:NlpC/P60 family protein n=1 Tax=Edwardsiella anguillarum TaxID=1821960 RepID=A0ABY8SJG7_9GAMM|nr:MULTISPECIES: NlpC/P60 family protein [Edwardsiella]AKM47833.1 endopeptidase [Edwardsiella sp. EA181011]AKR77809.1 NlpC/P60 family protein [Edwardsiella sp. LADL05-105]KAB0592075.1 endopeptidase [Edwardsiella anguillarum]RFT05386.1 endopeptidase [Edwardsiella anguillarum]UOU77482.1 NlpC/P60 family protein [Edwardsiella anguillarum]